MRSLLLERVLEKNVLDRNTLKFEPKLEIRILICREPQYSEALFPGRYKLRVMYLYLSCFRYANISFRINQPNIILQYKPHNLFILHDSQYNV